MDHLNIGIGDEFRPKYHGNNFDPKATDYDFHAFPGSAAAGWQMDGDYNFSPISTSSSGYPQVSFDSFLQSWLFFGLIAAVVDHVEWPSDFANLFRVETYGDQIQTERLTEFLNGWMEGETRDDTGRILRMFKSQVALDRARDIVHELCSSDGKKADKSDQDPTRVDKALGLSLMVLGETLANTKLKISERVGFNTRGWNTDLNKGWGTPVCVIESMEKRSWCKRTIHTLKGQLSSHATALLSVYMSNKENDSPTNEDHTQCTATKCKMISCDPDGSYETQHRPSCKLHDCQMIGPNLHELVKCIQADTIPLLEYKQDSEGRHHIDVVEYAPHKPYATISHVWSHGYGNPQENKLWCCQIQFLIRMLENAWFQRYYHSANRCLFWLDTLAIPVENQYKMERRKAIRKIREVYTKAAFTIVVDNSLSDMSADPKYEDTDMKIARAWMRRLRSLQEIRLGSILPSNTLTLASDYSLNLLATDRRTRLHDVTTSIGQGLLASVWEAMQRRITINPEQEHLALATLPNVDYTLAENISNAGDLPQGSKEEAQKDLEQMMKELWILLEEIWPDSIPPGVIFLPGERLSLKDFGWAPETWINGQGTQYPGILLHFIGQMDSNLRASSNSIEFPVVSSLLEWYQIKAVDSTDAADLGIKLLMQEPHRIAIVLCRPKPGEHPEIALLVRIVRDMPRQNPPTPDFVLTNPCQVEMISRIWIKRQTETESMGASRDSGDSFVYGEELDADQLWIIDSPRVPIIPRHPIEDLEDTDNESMANSIFSLPSVPSTAATGNSTLSFSEMKRASEELISIFFGDSELESLCRDAIDDLRIGPKRFARNFERLLKGFSIDLKLEGSEAAEFEVAKIISLEAGLVANEICRRIQLQYFDPVGTSKDAAASLKSVQESQAQQTKATFSEGGTSVMSGFSTGHSAGFASDSKEEKEDSQKRDNEKFLALVDQGRKFIRDSQAFKKLRQEFRNFVKPPRSHIARNSQCLAVLKELQIVRKALALCSTVGLREEPLSVGHQRIRWLNGRGKTLYDDFVELKPGALQARKNFLDTSAYRKMANNDTNQAANGPTSDPAVGSSRLRGSLTEANRPNITPDIKAASTASVQSDKDHTAYDVELAQPVLLHLLSCTEKGRYRTNLHYEHVADIADDRQLFRAMGQKYYERRGKVRAFWCLRTIHRIDLIKLGYGGSQYVDVRSHDDICVTGQPCECIPPADRVRPHGTEYECSPMPPELSPPIGWRQMMNDFTYPDDIAEGRDLVLRQLPKRTKGELKCQSDLVPAWGIYFKEGWNWIKIWWLLAVGFFVPSLLFGILWGSMRKDIQGAFGVAGWWMTAATIVISIIGTSSWTV